MKRMKYLVLLMLSVSIAITSCKKSARPDVDEKPGPPPAETGRYIPVKFEDDNFTLNLKYQENTALLTEIADSDNNTTLITYKNGKDLYKLERYRNKNLFYLVYYLQSDQKLSNKAIPFDYDNALNKYYPLGHYTLTYNEQQNINAIHYYDNVEKLTGTSILSYTEAMNLSEVNTTEYPGAAAMTKYTFDQGKGIASHMLNSALFAAELDYWFFLCAKNNLLSALYPQSPKEDASFSYEYNENGYPSTVRFTSHKSTGNIKITYQRLAP